jgi:hypothetical protein
LDEKLKDATEAAAAKVLAQAFALEDEAELTEHIVECLKEKQITLTAKWVAVLAAAVYDVGYEQGKAGHNHRTKWVAERAAVRAAAQAAPQKGKGQ